jgi:hypothetical protein
MTGVCPKVFDRLWEKLTGASSRQQVPHNLPVNIGEAEVAAGVAIGEPLVVEAEQVEDRGVEVVDMDLVFHGREAGLVGRAMNVAAADAAAGQPHAEAVMVVVAAAERGELGDGSAAELRIDPTVMVVTQSAGSSATGVRPNSPPHITKVVSNSPRCFRSWRNAAIARSHSPASLRCCASSPSWLSQGCPAPLQTWTNRTPRSSSRRVTSNCRAIVPEPYRVRIASGSFAASKASDASACIR